MTRPLSGCTAAVATGRDVTSLFPEGYIRNRDIPFQSVTFDATSITDELGIPTKAPWMLSVSCASLLRPFGCKLGLAAGRPATVVLALPTQ